MVANLTPTIDVLLPLLRRFSLSEYGIALGGAHAKGVEDAESDIDIYIFAREILPIAQRDALCRQFPGVENVTSWGEEEDFVQGGTDFYYLGKKVEVWFRSIDFISGVIADCQAGNIKRDYVTWTVMGFFNYCTLSDLNQMVPVEDPGGILARWKALVSHYPPEMRRRILVEYLNAARFWPENFHYKTAVARCDVLYTAGIVQQVVQNLIQVLFALNEVYFPGEKKLEAALDHLALKPERFAQRVKNLIFPGAPPSRDVLEDQRQELVRLLGEVEALLSRAGAPQAV